MRIPKEINQALEKRRIAAEMYNRYDEQIRDWLKENGISEDVSRSCLGRGKEAFADPRAAELAIRKAISEKSIIVEIR